MFLYKRNGVQIPMNVSISKVNHPEVYIIRIDGEYKGRLIRSNEIGPLWADKELNGFLGEPFTCDKRNEYEALKEFEDFVRMKQGYVGTYE